MNIHTRNPLQDYLLSVEMTDAWQHCFVVTDDPRRVVHCVDSVLGAARATEEVFFTKCIETQLAEPDAKRLRAWLLENDRKSAEMLKPVMRDNFFITYFTTPKDDEATSWIVKLH